MTCWKRSTTMGDGGGGPCPATIMFSAAMRLGNSTPRCEVGVHRPEGLPGETGRERDGDGERRAGRPDCRRRWRCPPPPPAGAGQPAPSPSRRHAGLWRLGHRRGCPLLAPLLHAGGGDLVCGRGRPAARSLQPAGRRQCTPHIARVSGRPLGRTWRRRPSREPAAAERQAQAPRERCRSWPWCVVLCRLQTTRRGLAEPAHLPCWPPALQGVVLSPLGELPGPPTLAPHCPQAPGSRRSRAEDPQNGGSQVAGLGRRRRRGRGGLPAGASGLRGTRRGDQCRRQPANWLR